MGNDTTGRRTTTYFAIVPEWLIGSVSANAIAVYCAIDRYADRDGYAFPSRKTLADRLDVSEPTVKRAVAELEKVGALVRFDRFRKDGSRTSNGYQLRRDPPI
jgi:biotin operon repressor